MFFRFFYLLQTLQYILTYLDSIGNILILYKFVYSNKLLSFNMKLIN